MPGPYWILNKWCQLFFCKGHVAEGLPANHSFFHPLLISFTQVIYGPF